MSRGGLSFRGVKDPAIYADSSIKDIVSAGSVDDVIGLAVTITDNETVGLGAAGNPIYGQIVQYETDGCVTVKTGEHAYFNGVSGSLPTPGTDFFAVVDGKGAVMASAGAVGGKAIVSVGSEVTGPVVVLLG